MDILKEIDDFFASMKKKALDAFIKIEGKDLVEQRVWDSPSGRTVLNITRGKVFEKVSLCLTNKRKKIPGSVNLPDIMKDLEKSKDTEVIMKVFEICSHMANPKVPVGNISLRYRKAKEGRFAGGTDLSPYFPFKEDVEFFRKEMQNLCKRHGKQYEPMREQLQKNFWLKYRNEPRGGCNGIGFDVSDEEFPFIKDLAETFLKTYISIVEKRKDEPFTEAEREKQLYRRGRWVEFNLVEDEGFRFGLEMGIDPEIMVLQTLPPLVRF
ncbi:MAG: hypothetical protein A2042_02750 [Candidatus Schekmanbacteria bacterium GWA2_38_11]|uniref:coproporphyrinogen oxidase n=1 Tax=Candidatus Schekmanbacteria bacterium GWA2_38_11 TaxID=1817876 RepID=A0A1F7RF10_9BACT|nr:MAG: hypothetical protein A2042_02750 [Candidatus Schekmanbacteria bacterium GWA2_38_11]